MDAEIGTELVEERGREPLREDVRQLQTDPGTGEMVVWDVARAYLGFVLWIPALAQVTMGWPVVGELVNCRRL